MSKYNRSKMGYLKTMADVQDRIDSHLLDQFDYVFITDSRQLCIISEDLEILPCRTQFDCYANESEANIAINKASYTYEGEIVMVQTGEDGIRPYVVQLNNEGKYHVVNVNSGHSTEIIDYNIAENIPITNVYADNEIFISDLTDGYYMVIGNYRFSEDDPTHRMTSRRKLFAVEHEVTEDNIDICYVTEFDAYRTKVYTIVPGYFNEDRYVLRSELESIIKEYLDGNVDGYIEDYIGTHLATNQDIQDMFQ